MTDGDARAHWEEQADAWLALTRSDPDYELLNKPSFLELVPPPGRLTLDVGCGEGRMARELTRRGHHVVGIDGAPSLARNARAHALRTATALADIARLPIRSGTADLVVCFMVLMDVETLDRAVCEIARVLSPRGVLCAAIMHPIFTSGLFVDGDPYQTFSMGAYATTMRHVLDVERHNGERMVFRIEHRPIERYSRALEQAGLAITHIREPVPSEAAVADQPSFANYRRVPEFLHLRAESLGR
ncbi:MAG TPA: class I SAM-dependent methyltransferase [Acidimicrobiia bacterium]